ncbi:uncharacterized protein LOC135839984 [Planococcus citri]|uniref:uncharacterized protein LOC135839984 n=1 Tax=Planococcus citri TaxID=170843 RepID=UPI0031F7BD75
MDKSSVEHDLFLMLGILSAIFCTQKDINLDYEDHEEETNLCKEIEDDKWHQNTLSVKSFVKDKAIEMYAKKGFDNVKKTLKNSEPFQAGSMDKEKVKDNDMDISFQLRNVKLYNLGSFQVKKFKSKSEMSSAEFAVDVPSIRANTDYNVNGTFKGKKVDGSGNADVNVTGISIDNGKIVIKETPEEIQIVSIDLIYDFKDLVVKQSGLNIEGFQPNEVTEFLNNSGKKYLKENRKKISSKVTSELKSRANAKLRGKNRDQLMEMFKNS